MAQPISVVLVMHLAAVLFFSNSQIVAAIRDDASVHNGDSIPTSFSSCVCQKDVVDHFDKSQAKPVILVTKTWTLGECNLKCPGFCLQDKAPFLFCMAVHTATGKTGNHLDIHHGVRANIVPDKEVPNVPDLDLASLNSDDLSQDVPMPLEMVRHETYSADTMFAACVCQYDSTGYHFLVGKENYMGGLQIWGRVGCDRSCSQECGSMGLTSKKLFPEAVPRNAVPGCIQAEVTKDEETPGPIGYKRELLTASLMKRVATHSEMVKHDNNADVS